ncbi:hypothetical protein LC76P1_00039 [Lysinibacillus phage LC76P1]|nr:hypothetical protein LC76P1_00039 [Lysinibacillus phage LC76P1]
MKKRQQIKLIRQVMMQPPQKECNRAQSKALRIMWKQFMSHLKIVKERENDEGSTR